MNPRAAAAADSGVFQHRGIEELNRDSLSRDVQLLRDNLPHDRVRSGTGVRNGSGQRDVSLSIYFDKRVGLAAFRNPIADGAAAADESVLFRIKSRRLQPFGQRFRRPHVSNTFPDRKVISVLHEVHTPVRHGIDAELFGNEVRLAFCRERALRMPRRPHIAAGKLVRVDVLFVYPCIRNPVGPEASCAPTR